MKGTIIAITAHQPATELARWQKFIGENGVAVSVDSSVLSNDSPAAECLATQRTALEKKEFVVALFVADSDPDAVYIAPGVEVIYEGGNTHSILDYMRAYGYTGTEDAVGTPESGETAEPSTAGAVPSDPESADCAPGGLSVGTPSV